MRNDNSSDSGKFKNARARNCNKKFFTLYLSLPAHFADEGIDIKCIRHEQLSKIAARFCHMHIAARTATSFCEMLDFRVSIKSISKMKFLYFQRE